MKIAGEISRIGGMHRQEFDSADLSSGFFKVE